MKSILALIPVVALFLWLTAQSLAQALPRGSPEAQGVSSAGILDFVESAENKLDVLHSFMLIRHGHVVAEGWWVPYAANERHMLFSLSKSFTSTAVGLAINEGKLNLDDTVLGFFPEEAPPKASQNLKAMRVRDLLMMSTGHHSEDIASFSYLSESSLVRAFLALPVAHKPGTHFLYNTPASYMLSAIVQKVTGQTVLDYLQPRLFAPLGISRPVWQASKQGISMGGFGLSVTTEDIARFGLLYLQKGSWQGKTLLPASWVDMATARQTSNGSAPNSDWEQGYGFQFWRCRYGFYRGDGAHGQYCIVMPEYDAVIALTSGTRDLAAVMNLVWEKIIPALKAENPPVVASVQRALADKLAHLRLPTPHGTVTPPESARASLGKRFVFPALTSSGEGIIAPANPQPLEAVTFRSTGASGAAAATTLELRFAGKDYAFTLQPDRWQNAPSSGIEDAEAFAISGAWTGETTLVVKLALFRTPFCSTYTLDFSDTTVSAKVEHNVGPNAKTPLLTQGKAD